MSNEVVQYFFIISIVLVYVFVRRLILWRNPPPLLHSVKVTWNLI